MDGYTPLHLAVISHNPNIVSILSRYGPKFNKTFVDNKLRTPLFFVISDLNDHLKFLEGKYK